jgi:hypothetical protein
MTPILPAPWLDKTVPDGTKSEAAGDAISEEPIGFRTIAFTTPSLGGLRGVATFCVETFDELWAR